MTRETYQLAGEKHVKNDIKVGYEDLKEAQRELNGHVAMAIKRFTIGGSWNHTERVRETMLGEGLATCPVSLLFKDHKKWENGSNKVPPTRHVAGGHVGMNLHLSEILYNIVENLVGTLEGSEVISTEDLLAQVDMMNEELRGWHYGWWWENKVYDKYSACGTCIGVRGCVMDKDEPELCYCGRKDLPEVKGNTWATLNFVRSMRRLAWEVSVDV